MSKVVRFDDVLAVCFICRRPSTSRWASSRDEAQTVGALCDEHKDALPGWRQIFPAPAVSSAPVRTTHKGGKL